MCALKHILLYHRQQTRSYFTLGAYAHPSLSLVSPFRRGRSNKIIRCSSSSVWRGAFVQTNASGESVEGQSIDQTWEKYFADPLQWWDKRDDKMDPKLADFEHKVTKEALWIDGGSTPSWVKAMLKLHTCNKSYVGRCTSDAQDIVQPNRLPMGNSGRRNTFPSSAKDSKHIVRVGSVITDMRSVKTTSEAIDVLKNLLQQGIAINSYVYAEVLKRCLLQEDLQAVKQVHECIIESGMQQNTYVANNLVMVYSRCGRLEDARKVFDDLVMKDVVSWNVMIGGYAKHLRAEDAMEVFHRMHHEGLQPSAITYLCILKACASPSALKWGQEIHAYIRRGDFDSDVRVGSALVHMYAKCGSIDDARLVFDKLDERNVITWNVIIGAHAASGYGEEAYRLFLQMIREGLKPDAFTYANILNACASAGTLEWVKEVHKHAREAGFESDVRVGSALVHMYAKCSCIDDARLVFDRMENRDLITWNIMICASAESGSGEEAYRLFLQMIGEGFKPDAFTFSSILNACASAGTLEWVKEVHRHACEAGFFSDVRVGSSLVHMYAKCGSVDDARLVFDRMETRDVISWNVMIGGLGQHGCGSEALEVFHRMIAAGVKPDDSSFVAVLSACSHSGLVDEGRRLFAAMSQDHGIECNVRHFTCMVDILGRAGHLEEAKLFIDNMPVEPDGATWGALLGACRSYGHVQLGEIAAREYMKLEPKNESAYVLLSNIYATAKKWDKVSWVRREMQKRGIHKEAGRSWIEVDNKIHVFVVGDTSHPESKEIYAELRRLTEKIKAEGYLADTQVVLQDIEEKDKEFSLCSHSEKLAIAYGLLCTSSEKPIRVYKNLRVCLDCHMATKLISKVTRREIVVRDVNRFHHFKDGLCSCKDYW